MIVSIFLVFGVLLLAGYALADWPGLLVAVGLLAYVWRLSRPVEARAPVREGSREEGGS